VPIVQITTAQIVDWPSFHDVFANALGFPEFYGRNMNAWVDCLTYADEDDGMRNVVVPAGEVLTLELDGVASFAKRCPEQYAAVVESSAFVNWRRIEQGRARRERRSHSLRRPERMARPTMIGERCPAPET
jgi:hypothetical protein